MSTTKKAVLTWILFIPLVIFNAFLREKGYKPFVGDLAAHQISTVTAAAAFITFAFFMMKNNLEKARTRQIFFVGFIWVFMTICFEFGFGHFLEGIPWERLFADYNVLKGRIWGVLLLVIFMTPYLITVIRTMKW